MGLSLHNKIKYLKYEDLKKLEEYLYNATYHDLKKKMYFKFIGDREQVEISDDSGRTIIISLDNFINETWRKLNIFFKFKDLTEDDINKPVKSEFLEKYRKIRSEKEKREEK